MSYAKKLVQGTLLLFLMNILASAATYFTRIILARSLSPAEYGLFYSVFTLVIFFLFFRDLGQDAALTRYIAKYRVTNNYAYVKTVIISVFSMQLVSSLILISVFYWLTPYLAQYYFKDSRAVLLLYLMLGYVFFSVFYRILKCTFQGFQKTFFFSLFDASKLFLIFILSYIFLKLGWGVSAAAWPYLFSPLIVVLIFYFPFKKLFPFKEYHITDLSKISKKTFYFGLAVTLTDFGEKVIGYVDTLMLTYYVSLTEVGVYNVILPTALIIMFLGRSLISVLYPIITEMWSKKEFNKISLSLFLFNRYSFFLILPVLLWLFVYAQEFLRIMFGSEYVVGALALQIVLIGTLFFMVAMINQCILSAIGKPKEVTFIILFAALVNFLANLYFIPTFGISGAAFTTALSYFIAYILTTWRIKKYFSFILPIKIWLKLLIPTILLYLTLIWSRYTYLSGHLAYAILLILLAVGIYITFSLILKIIELAEIKKYLLLVGKGKNARI